ncbi:MAG: GNAT family N-acetyltransferase [Chloroflexota bacterium]
MVSHSPKSIQTGRLVLRPLTLDHVPDLHHVYNHPDAMRFWDVPPHTDEAETGRILSSMLTETACWWGVFLKSAETAIGTVGYIGNPGVPGIGYILHPDYWRQGYMSEALRAILDYGFDNLGISRAELWINEDNLASQRLAESVGFVRRGQFRQKYHHHPMSHDKYVYGMHIDDWRRPHDQAPVPQNHAHFYSACPILAVSDVEATVKYYQDQLGFNRDFLFGDPATFGQVSRGEWSFEVVRIQFSQEENLEDHTPKTALSINVGPDVEGLCETYRAANVTIVREPEKMPWGMHEFAIRDLNGYLIRFATPA